MWFKHKKSPYFIALMLLIAAIFLFASCRLLPAPLETEEPTGQEEAEVAEEAETGITSAQVAIEIWDYIGPTERLTLMDSIGEFQNQNPQIAVQTRHIRSEEELLDQFEAASLAGSGPDLVLTDLVNVQRLAESKVVREIDNIDFEIFLKGLAEISTYSGINYAVPFRTEDFLVFYYNQAYLDEAPRDFEEVLEYSQLIEEGEEQAYGFILNESEPDWIIPFIGGYGEWIVDYNNYSLSLDTDALEKTLNFLLTIYDSQEPLVPSGMEYEEMNTMFKSGNLHMIINSITVLDQYLEENMEVQVARIPEVYGENKRPTPLISGIGFMINANCYGQELESAQAFIEFMLSTGQQIEWTRDTETFPVILEAKEETYILNNSRLSSAFSQAELCRGIPPDEIIRAVRDALRINLPQVLEGELPVEEAIVKIQEDAIRLRAGSITVEQLMEESLQQ